MHYHVALDDENGTAFCVGFATEEEVRAARIGIDNVLMHLGYVGHANPSLPSDDVLYTNPDEAGSVGGFDVYSYVVDGDLPCDICRVA